MAAFVVRDLRSTLILASLLGALACGPSSPGSEGTSNGSTSDGATTGSPDTTTGMASGTGTVPAMTSTGVAESTGETFADTLVDGCPFICPPDATHPDQPCDPVAQDCGEGEKCVWYVAPGSQLRRDAARCIPVTGDGQPFDPCTLPTGIGPAITDDCGAESYCLEVYGTADHGFCAPFLDGPSYTCDAHPGTTPAIENGSEFPAACLHYECQPLVEDSCPAGMQCTFYPAFLYGTTMCWTVPPEADLPLGAACDFGDCGQGELCVPAEWLPGCAAERCCTQWCDLGAPGCGDPATACEHFPVWAGDDDPDFEWLGACVLPGSLE
jgi:hypothetical protein